MKLYVYIGGEEKEMKKLLLHFLVRFVWVGGLGFGVWREREREKD